MEITKQDKASVGTLSASFGRYALILLMSPRLIVLVICSENERANHMGGKWEPPRPLPELYLVQGPQLVRALTTSIRILSCLAGSRAMMMGPVPRYIYFIVWLSG